MLKARTRQNRRQAHALVLSTATLLHISQSLSSQQSASLPSRGLSRRRARVLELVIAPFHPRLALSQMARRTNRLFAHSPFHSVVGCGTQPYAKDSPASTRPSTRGNSAKSSPLRRGCQARPTAARGTAQCSGWQQGNQRGRWAPNRDSGSALSPPKVRRCSRHLEYGPCIAGEAAGWNCERRCPLVRCHFREALPVSSFFAARPSCGACGPSRCAPIC